MGAPEDNLAVDSEKVQMAQAQMRTEGTNQPVGEPGFVGGVKELGKGIARGAAVTVPEMAGKALEWFDPEGGDTAVSDYGRSMVKSAEQRLKDNPSLQQSALADVKSEDSAFSLRGKAGEGGEMLAPSMGAPLAGAGIGFALGGPPGAAIGAAGGFLASLPLYFGSQAQDTYERVKPEQLKKAAQAGLTGQAADEFAHDEAWKAGVLTGGIEAGGEAIADRVTFGLFRLLPRKIKSDLVRSATKGLRGPGELAKDFAKIVAAETGTELAQGAGQQEVEQAYGVGEGASWESTKGVILPTIILSAMTFGAAEPVGAMQRRALNKVLANPEADPAQRQAAVEAVGQAVGQQDPELGKLWMESATAQLAKGEAIVANEDEYYRNLGVEPDAPEEEKAQAVKQAVGTPMPISPMEAGLLPNAGPLTRAVAAGGQAPASPAADYRGIGDQEAAQQAQADMQATATQEADSELKALRKERSDLAGIKTKGQQAAAAKRIEEIDKRVLELTGNATEQKPEKQAEPGKTDETPKTGLDRPATKSIRQQEAEAAAQEKPEQKRGILEELAPVPAPETETKTETAEQKRQRLIDEKKRRPAPEPAAPAVQMTPAQGVTIDETPPGPVAEDPRMKRETYRGALKQMVSELTEGGGIAIVPKDGAKPTSDTGDVIYDYGNQEITRTPSINPDWFKRWDIEVGKKPTVKEVRTAVEKALAGEKLGKPQERIIRGLLDNIEGERTEPPSMEAAKAERDQQRETRKEGFGGKRAEAPQLPGAEQDPGIKLLDDAISEAQRLGVSQKRIDYLLEQGAQTDEAPAELAKYIKHESGQAKKGIPPFLRDDYEPTTSGIKGETDEQVAARKAEREGEFPGEPQTEADTATSPRPIPPIDDAGGIPALEQEEIDRAAGPRPIAITDELDVDQAAPALELQPQTIEDLERLQQEEEARADAQRQEAQKAEADANLGGFTLTGSNRPADEAAAAGQTSLLDITDQPEAAAKPETVTEPETVTKPTKITLPELPFKPEQLEGVTMFVEWETENDMGRDDFQASWLLSQSERRLDMLNKLGECLVK
jgi:hypothetical protein